DQAMRTASDSEFTGPFAYYALMHAYLLARQGRDEESRAIRESLHPRVNASPGVAFLAACVTGMEHLSAGRFDQAVTALREADDIGRRSGGVVPGLGTRSADEFEALWRAGRLDEAAAVAAAYSSEAAVTGHPTDLALAARCRAALSAPLDLDDAFAAALSSMDPVSMPFETARTRLIHGQRLRRERRKADAVRELAAALDLFGRLGAETWSETTRRELAACGRRRTSARPGSPLGELTPREHAVAQEAARGRTNAEAAARLFISPRTVEYHLANSYRKLGVRDRQALAQFFGE
ncbi:MAG: LuxR C-terminal-related transcriptional regulator, partial [Nocardioides sp.]|nr:LuxR C-terminal-related transcriptional regulator [Nocardioides sp.]